MLDQVTGYFGIEPDRDLDLMRPDQTLAEVTARCLTGLDAALAEYRPHCVVAQGDTTTVMAAALAAFYRRVPFVHVEAGLRTGNLQAPWPEELNRRIAGLATALHCAADRAGGREPAAEGVPPETVHVTGNTVIDALLWTVARERGQDRPWREKYAAAGRPPHGAGDRPPPRELRRRHGADLHGDPGRWPGGFPRSSSSIRSISNPHVREPVMRLLAARRTSASASRRPIPSSSG